MKKIQFACFFSLLLCSNSAEGQDTAASKKKMPDFKNVIRYNLSSALFLGFDKSIVFGYERVIRPNQSISVNFGKISMPKIVSIDTDSFKLNKDVTSSGVNLSIDYRFYLPKENKHLPPHGLYIGPYYSFNRYTRENRWDYARAGSNDFVITNSELTINTVGFELGYQFVLWKRLTLDLLMVGPGVGFYNFEAKIDNSLDEATKEQLRQGLDQLLTQRFPGLNFVFSDEAISGNGTMNTTSIGYRYLVQVGFNF